MEQTSLIFSQSEACTREAFVCWQKRNGILRKPYLFLICFLIDLFAGALTLGSMFLEEEFDIIAAVLLIAVQTVFFTFMTIRTISRRIVPELAKSYDLRFRKYSDKTQITLFEDNFEIKTEYRKTNYYYDEVKYCVEKYNFCMIVVDEYVSPVIIPLIFAEKGKKEEFLSVLREKLKDKYERGV